MTVLVQNSPLGDVSFGEGHEALIITFETRAPMQYVQVDLLKVVLG